MTELLPNIFAIEVPLDADPNEWKIFDVDGKSYLNGLTEDGEMYAGLDPLPPGSYEIMFTTKGVSEQDAKKVVEKYYNGGAAIYPFYFRDYEKKDIEFSYGTATESLQSLLKSKGLTAENYLIIKKVEG